MVKKDIFVIVCSLSFSACAFADNTKSTSIHYLDLSATPHYEFNLAALYVQPGADNLGWAAVTTVLPIPTPQWHIRTLAPDFHPGFNLSARYICPNGNMDYKLSWTHLQTHDTESVSVDPASQWVSPFSQTGTPPTLTAITGVAELKFARARLDFNYDVINFDWGNYVALNSRNQLRIFSGVSGVHIREQLKSRFHGTPLPILAFNNTTSYLGIGPRLGLNNQFNFYQRFNLVTEFAGSLLWGRMHPAEYKFTGASRDLLLVRILRNREKIGSEAAYQVVSAVDAKIGLSYTQPLPANNFYTFEIGVTGALYIHPLSSYETNTNVIALDTGSLSTSSVRHVQSNFSMAGFYASISWVC